jgi:hypothetical protein
VSPHFDDPEKARAAGRLGAAKQAAQRAARAAYPGTFLAFMTTAGLIGPSWDIWRVLEKAVDGLSLTAAELAVFQRHTGRPTSPTAPVSEVCTICGRRSGKTRERSTRAFYEGVRRNWRELLAPGEQAVIPVIAADRKQARQALGYVKGLARLPEFKPYVGRELKEAVELNTGVTIEVHTASYRTTRGYTVVGLVADEIAFWRSDDDGANPDSEVLAALRPGMATVPGALLMMLSTPYARRGELFTTWERYFGTDDPSVLVWVADTRSMNPTVAARVIEDAYLRDPTAAASEYGQDGSIVFRSDVEAFLTPEAIAAVTMPGRLELAPAGGSYVGFVDPSGGSSDSMTLAIAHRAGERAVLDLVREVRPPFSPESVVKDFAEALKAYRLRRVTGDHYAGEWPRERFSVHGVDYRPSERTKSDLYRELLPMVNAGACELLDLPLLRAQLVGLERRTSRGGKDSIDHAPAGRDDVANAAAGALVAVGAGQPGEQWIQFTREQVLGIGPTTWDAAHVARGTERTCIRHGTVRTRG